LCLKDTFEPKAVSVYATKYESFDSLKRIAWEVFLIAGSLTKPYMEVSEE
jgi:hypothetical protein